MGFALELKYNLIESSNGLSWNATKRDTCILIRCPEPTAAWPWMSPGMIIHYRLPKEVVDASSLQAFRPGWMWLWAAWSALHIAGGWN